MAVETDVSRVEDIGRSKEPVAETFGGVDVLMNNAGMQPGQHTVWTGGQLGAGV